MKNKDLRQAAIEAFAAYMYHELLDSEYSVLGVWNQHNAE